MVDRDQAVHVCREASERVGADLHSDIQQPQKPATRPWNQLPVPAAEASAAFTEMRRGADEEKQNGAGYEQCETLEKMKQGQTFPVDGMARFQSDPGSDKRIATGAPCPAKGDGLSTGGQRRRWPSPRSQRCGVSP